MKLMALPVLAIALAGATGCQTSPENQNDRTMGQAIDDHTVTSNVKSALRHEPVYKFEDVNVSTYRGVVQLSGWANTQAQKDVAGRLARDVRGVQNVVNNITVREIGSEREPVRHPVTTPTEERPPSER